MLTVYADVYLPEADDMLLNVDSDDPGTVANLMSSTGLELWKLRLASMIGYGPCSNGKPSCSSPWIRPSS